MAAPRRRRYRAAAPPAASATAWRRTRRWGLRWGLRWGRRWGRRRVAGPFAWRAHWPLWPPRPPLPAPASQRCAAARCRAPLRRAPRAPDLRRRRLPGRRHTARARPSEMGMRPVRDGRLLGAGGRFRGRRAPGQIGGRASAAFGELYTQLVDRTNASFSLPPLPFPHHPARPQPPLSRPPHAPVPPHCGGGPRLNPTPCRQRGRRAPGAARAAARRGDLAPRGPRPRAARRAPRPRGALRWPSRPGAPAAAAAGCSWTGGGGSSGSSVPGRSARAAATQPRLQRRRRKQRRPRRALTRSALSWTPSWWVPSPHRLGAGEGTRAVR
jgi:hypothetical protein